MAHVHFLPTMTHKTREAMAARLGMQLVWNGGEWVMQTPNHDRLNARRGEPVSLLRQRRSTKWWPNPRNDDPEPPPTAA